MTKLATIEILQEYTEWKPFILSLPQLFRERKGNLIHDGRNKLRRFEYQGKSIIVKEFHRPNLINRFVYGVLRPSKAKRSFYHAQLLQHLGIGTPAPIAYMTLRNHGFFDLSYYVTLASDCRYDYSEIMNAPGAYDDVLQELALTTACLHTAGYWHKDYGRGNILFDRDKEGKVKLEVIDLNRIGHGKVDIHLGCENFNRLPATPHMHHVIAETYARARGFEANLCYQLITEARRKDKVQEEF